MSNWLKEIKDQLKESNLYDDNPNGYWYHNINRLIEQAERVKELEELKVHYGRQIQALTKWNDKGIKQNKLYREALEFYADHQNLIDASDSPHFDITELARKALDSELKLDIKPSPQRGDKNEPNE